MTTKETIKVDNPLVTCNGDKDGHPLVYLNMGSDKKILCPYCGKMFTLVTHSKGQ